MRLKTAILAASSLVGGYAAARYSGRREAGGLVLALGGIPSAISWYRMAGPGRAAACVGVYLGAFGVSHPLAKAIGPWPSVLAVSATTAVATFVIADVPKAG